jgi:adenine-specific DNA-methyltransferase
MILSYLGSKQSLLPYLDHVIKPLLTPDTRFADVFLGSGCVSNHYKNDVKAIESCDAEIYSFVLGKALTQSPFTDNLSDIIDDLNKLTPVKGLVYTNFATNNKLFFSEHNAMCIDAIRIRINRLYDQDKVTYKEFIFLLGSLLTSASAFSNTCGTFRAYLKVLSKKALKAFKLGPIHTDTKITCTSNISCTNVKNKSFTSNVAYLDPPYNSAHYGAYYSFLNYLCHYNPNIELVGTGIIKDYNKSKFGLLKTCKNEFNQLFKKLNSDHIILSYSSKAVLNIHTILQMLVNKGDIIVYKVKHKSYTPNAKCKYIIEYIVHINCLASSQSIVYKWLRL